MSRTILTSDSESKQPAFPGVKQGILNLIEKADQRASVELQEFDQLLNLLALLPMPVAERKQATDMISAAAIYLLEKPHPFYAGYEAGSAKWCLTQALRRIERVAK